MARNSWSCVWGVRAGVQEQCSGRCQPGLISSGSSAVGWRTDGHCLCGFAVSVASFLNICMVDQYGEPGGLLPDAPMLLEGKAVGDISAGFRSFADILVSSTSSGWQTSRSITVNLVTLAACRALRTGPSSALCCISLLPAADHLNGSSQAVDIWRFKLSGAGGGVPPAYR